MVYEGRMNAGLFIVFLTRLIAWSSKKRLLIVDNLSIHEIAAVEEWLADKKDKFGVFCLPKYAPEWTPDEYLRQLVRGNLPVRSGATGGLSAREGDTRAG